MRSENERGFYLIPFGGAVINLDVHLLHKERWRKAVLTPNSFVLSVSGKI